MKRVFSTQTDLEAALAKIRAQNDPDQSLAEAVIKHWQCLGKAVLHKSTPLTQRAALFAIKPPSKMIADDWVRAHQMWRHGCGFINGQTPESVPFEGDTVYLLSISHCAEARLIREIFAELREIILDRQAMADWIRISRCPVG